MLSSVPLPRKVSYFSSFTRLDRGCFPTEAEG